MFLAIGLGILVIILGIFNMKGDLSSIHWYHRQRLTEEHKEPYGKKVGFGTVLCGISLILYGSFSLLAEKLQNALFMQIGSVVMIFLLIIGLAVSIYAMIKYNKGIF